ncbi:MAG: CHAT domain-containing protein [Xanthobacteraceae bacterium]
MGLLRAGHDGAALKEFKTAAPILVGSRDTQSEEDDAIGAAARDQRVRSIVESYIALLVRTGPDGAADAFQLAEDIRGQSVQKALAASAARAVAGNSALAELARREQDLSKQVSAQLGLLSNILARPPQQRDDRAINDLRAGIERLRHERTAAQHEIAQKFPDYAALIEPQPPRVEQVQKVLKADEAFLSFYLGQENSYVWAVPKQGPMGFATIPLSAAEIEKRVTRLRTTLEPNVSTIDEIPPFDLALAYELYGLLLQPVEGSWRPARNLLVATNGALGLLPLGLLPTAKVEIDGHAEPLFAAYRTVPWLARSHAVTLLPSASALRTLRQLPTGSDQRERLVGFGDPLFNAEQAAEAEHEQSPVEVASAITLRGIPLQRRAAPQVDGIDRVELASLPRLPDTAEELKSVALALKADPAKVLHLGKDANEATVKNTDLSHYKVIVFATHGLVPGELDGLHQPALALTAPDVAGVPGDGLLTMDKILGLKLDADWVVLSACNTGAGAGAGAEAASGLGRAFFYAGTRAILVTNWSVHSQSARELVTDLFRRQAADMKISRAEALRQAMMDLLDSHGFADDSGKILFTYGHPLFWAPYTIIGDAG